MSNALTITVKLTEEEAVVIAALTQEMGLNSPCDVLLTLLYDAWWDKTFEASQDVLDKPADEAHTEYLAGLTE